MFYNQEYENDNDDCPWPGSIICAIQLTFPIASQVKSFLDILRAATCNTFSLQALITKCVYFKIIIACWFTAFTLAIVIRTILSQEASPCAWVSFGAVTLLVLVVCYIIIIVNVQSNPHSQHRGSIHKERKLSVTLFIVTGVSVLTDSSFDYFQLTASRRKEKMAQCTKLSYSPYPNGDKFCKFHRESSCIRHTNAGI